jgi:serine protease inhibitor
VRKRESCVGADLIAALGALGITAAVHPNEADFSPMTVEHAPLFVGSVVHQVVVKLDEAGTKAAATTTMTMPTMAMAAFRMVVDHPFFFAIHGATSEDLLFIGAVRML